MKLIIFEDRIYRVTEKIYKEVRRRDEETQKFKDSYARCSHEEEVLFSFLDDLDKMKGVTHLGWVNADYRR